MTGFEASDAQRRRVKGRACIYCGSEGVDPAHLWDRGKDGHGGCDDRLCVVPLCRRHHDEYDAKKLDILPMLVDAGCFDEMAHVIEAHRVSPARLVQRLTGDGGTADPMPIVRPVLSQIKQHRQATESRIKMLASAAGKPDAWPDNVMGQDRLLYEVAREVEEELAVAGYLDGRP
jgi:hypothetical protein